MQTEDATCHGKRGPLAYLSDPYLSKMNFQITIHLSNGGSDSIPYQPYCLKDICT